MTYEPHISRRGVIAAAGVAAGAMAAVNAAAQPAPPPVPGGLGAAPGGQVFHSAEIDHDAATFGEKGLDRFPELIGRVANEFAVAFHRFDFVSKLIVP